MGKDKSGKVPEDDDTVELPVDSSVQSDDQPKSGLVGDQQDCPGGNCG